MTDECWIHPLPKSSPQSKDGHVTGVSKDLFDPHNLVCRNTCQGRLSGMRFRGSTRGGKALDLCHEMTKNSRFSIMDQ